MTEDIHTDDEMVVISDVSTSLNASPESIGKKKTDSELDTEQQEEAQEHPPPPHSPIEQSPTPSGSEPDESMDAADLPPPPVPPKGQKFVLNGSGTEVYVTEQPAKGADRIVILLTNSLGLASENNLKLADNLAQRLACPVVVPDLFGRDPIKVSGADMPPDPTVEEDAGAPSSGKSALGQLKAFAVNMVKGFMDEMWLAKHTFDRTYPHLAETVSELIQVYKPRKIGVIGYSFGGRYVLRLLHDEKHNEWSSDEYLVTVGASINPSLLEESDFDKVGKPLLVVHSAHDSVLKEDVISAGVAQLKAHNVDIETKLIEGLEPEMSEDGQSHSDVNLASKAISLPHGFAVPGDYPKSVVGDRPEQVMEAVVSFISKHMTD